MFVPVVTKDMQLFQNANAARNAAANIRLKNVRSRAQSLEDSLNKTNRGAVGKTVPISASTASVNMSLRANRAAQRQRNSQSVGALPTTASLAIRQKNGNNLTNNSTTSSLNNGLSRSPPKIRTISTLDTIEEHLTLATTTNKENENTGKKLIF